MKKLATVSAAARKRRNVYVDTAEGMKPYQEPAKSQLLDAYWRGSRSVEIEVTLDDGPYAGHKHKYVVYWIGGVDGLQFSQLRTGAAVRNVTLAKKKWEEQSEWEAKSSSWDVWG